jgi:hypothetical protein
MLAPAAISGVFAVLALAGGFGRIQSFAQVFSGPALPAAPGLPGRAATSLGRDLATASAYVPAAGRFTAPNRAVRLTVSRGGSGRTTTVGGAGAGGANQGSTGSRAGSPGSRGAGESAAVGSGGGGSGPGGSGGSSASGGSGGATSPLGALLGQVTTTASSVTSRLPGPVGAAATQVVTTAGSTVSGLIPGAGLPGGRSVPPPTSLSTLTP